MTHHLVTDVGSAQAFLRWLGERRPILAIDTETSGFSVHRDALRLVQFGDSQSGWALSYRDWRGVIVDALGKYDLPMCFANASFDLGFLAYNGLPVPTLRNTHDVLVMDRLANPGLRHGLKIIGARMGWAPDEQDALKEAMSTYGWTWATIPEDFPDYWRYACQDTVLTARIYESLSKSVASQGLTPAYEREMVVQDVMARAERRGLRIDVAYTTALRDRWEQEMVGIRKSVPEFDLCNPGKLMRVLMRDGWEPQEWTPTGKPKFTADVREKLKDTFARKHTRYKRIEKWSATYLNAFLDERDGNDRVHARVNTMQAITGRMSVTNPALQTLPRGAEIRNCIIADEGQVLWSIDQSNVEARLFTHYSQDPGLLSAVRSGVDLHTFSASSVYGVGMDAVTPTQRQLAKNTLFCRIYGGGPQKIADTAGVPFSDAQGFVDAYEAAFPGVKLMMDEVVALARFRERTEGTPYIKTWGGRRVPNLDGRIYALTNALIQGTAADVFKTMVVDLDAAGLSDNIVLPVHDELIFQFPDGDRDSIQKCAELMRWPDTFSVPLDVGISGPAQCWGKLEK